MSKIKLTQAMTDVIRLMRDGWTLYVTISGYPRLSKTHLSYTHFPVHKSTFSALIKHQIVEFDRLIHPDAVQKLTELGKTIDI